jgi:DNA-binding NtrC family response regulator
MRFSRMSVRILIVEEDRSTREAFLRVTSALGHDCTPAENVAQALTALSAEVFGLCVVSLGLPPEAFRAIRAAAAQRGVAVCDLPASLRAEGNARPPAILDLPPHGVDLRTLLSELEDRLIGQALERTGGNKNRAAGLLGMNRTTLVEKLRRRSVA